MKHIIIPCLRRGRPQKYEQVEPAEKELNVVAVLVVAIVVALVVVMVLVVVVVVMTAMVTMMA